MKKKNVLIILLVAAFAVWSNNIYRIITGLQQVEDTETLITPVATSSRETTANSKAQPEVFAYQAKFRNPFENWLEHKSNEVKQPVVARGVEKVEAIPPALRFSGIVRDHANVLAIIETPDGQVFFAQPHDTIAGVKLVRIDSSSITCQFAKRVFQIELQ